MISEDPSLAEIVKHGVEAGLSQVFKAGPAEITAYDPVTNTAFVKPSVKHSTYDVFTGERSYNELPEIPFVPVCFPRAGDFVMRLPMKKGDTVLLVYCDASMAEWRDGGGTTEPEDARLHSIGWPVAIPGLFPDSSPMSPIDAIAAASSAIFGAVGGAQVQVSSSGINITQAGVPPISPVALSVPTDAGIAGCITAINAMMTVLASLIAALGAHTHAVPTPAGPTGPMIPAGPMPSAPAPLVPAPTTASLMTKSL